MSLLAEVVVEEWLNRQGYFTIRGVRLGVDEMDILAIRVLPNGEIERRHIEVQASVRPISHICHLPKDVQKSTKRVANTPTRSREELIQGVKEWVDKKYRKPNKVRLFAELGGGTWSQELVIHNVKSTDEVEVIRSHGIKIVRLADIVKDLRSSKTPIKAASGAELLELMHLASPDDSLITETVEMTIEVE